MLRYALLDLHQIEDFQGTGNYHPDGKEIRGGFSQLEKACQEITGQI